MLLRGCCVGLYIIGNIYLFATLCSTEQLLRMNFIILTKWTGWLAYASSVLDGNDYNLFSFQPQMPRTNIEKACSNNLALNTKLWYFVFVTVCNHMFYAE